jgi:hypothetical protein
MGRETMDEVRELVRLGKWDRLSLGQVLGTAAAISEARERIEYISGQFLGTPYEETTLVGSSDVPEKLVICLQAVDCFTYIDYVESMRLSLSFDDFREQLRMVRYRSGVVAYAARNHFFTDWAESPRVRDVSADVGLAEVRSVVKVLNRKGDGSLFLSDIPERKRTVTFIPAEALDEGAMDRLRTGDYVGIYTEADGLDVSHVGIIVKRQGGVYFRHASVVEKMVIDQDFRSYLAGKPGIIVLRPTD